MKISVIIPHINRKEHLKMCLNALLQQNFTKEDFQIVVVGEMPDEIKMTEESNFLFVPVSFTEKEAFCPSLLRNMGAQKAQGEVLVFLDCDIIVSPDFLKNTWNELCHDYKLVFTLRYNIPEDVIIKNLDDLKHVKCEKDVREIVCQLFNTDYTKIKSIWMWAATHTLSLHRELFFSSGCFSEKFIGWGGEDTEFGYRLYKMGIPIVCDLNSKCYHLWHGDPLKYDKKKFSEASRNLDIIRRIHNDPILKVLDICKLCSSLKTSIRLTRLNINPLVFMLSMMEIYVRGFYDNNLNSKSGLI